MCFDLGIIGLIIFIVIIVKCAAERHRECAEERRRQKIAEEYKREFKEKTDEMFRKADEDINACKEMLRKHGYK